jgi:hypothetical protein
MAENKTKPTKASVADYIAARASDEQRADLKVLMALLKKVTKASPKMWGPSIVGYGTYTYTYESGRTGEMCRVGFAVRGRELVLYLLAEDKAQQALLKKVGKYRMGKSCFYFKRLADLDLKVLEQLIVNSLKELDRRYPA